MTRTRRAYFEVATGEGVWCFSWEPKHNLLHARKKRARKWLTVVRDGAQLVQFITGRPVQGFLIR